MREISMATLDSIQAVIAAYVSAYHEASVLGFHPANCKRDCIQWMCDYVGVRYGEAREGFGADTLDYIDAEISRQARF